jgi:S1-C subfamily serine protease
VLAGWLAGALLVGAHLVAAPSARAEEASPGARPGTTGAASAEARRYGPSIVRVQAKVPSDAQSASSLGARRDGSGVIVGDRLVLTIGYLLLEAEEVDVTTASGRKVPGAVAGYDHSTGFGLVRTALPMDGQPIELGDSDRIGERQTLYTQGHGETEATELIVVSRKTFTGGWEYMVERPIYTFPPVNNWSGSALIAQDGKLVGIGSLIVNDAASAQRGVPGNLFVPVNLLKPILEDLKTTGRRRTPSQPWLGLSTEVVRGNLMVVRVSREGPADEAGIAPGDIILGVGADKVSDQADFYRRVWALGGAGVSVPLRVLKGGDVREVPVKSIDRSDFLRKPSGV